MTSPDHALPPVGPPGTDAAAPGGPTGDLRPLPTQRVEVWTLRPEDLTQEEARREHGHLMSEAEQARYQRFHGDRLRHDFLMARALVRRTLSRYADVQPEEWRFEIGSHGKPSVAATHRSPLRFNLSHTRGLIACAVRAEEEVGLDVETRARRNDITRIADRFFSAEEVRALRALPAGEHPARFFTYWALKEAYIKARGLGLAIPLGAFTFHVEGPGPIGIRFDERITRDPGGWRFHHRWATDVHSLAVATPRATDALEVHVHPLERLLGRD
ncbi:MAG: 4'-phosphopantetheinyl transferase superfamily protein [Planctomycetota bacterium]|nr:4'-phosphopantetheinyl transferase superfamily protein [Planctomycetota bacterium]